MRINGRLLCEERWLGNKTVLEERKIFCFFTTGETGTLCSSGLGGLHFAWARGNGVRAQEPLAVLARSNKSTMDTHSNVHRGPGFSHLYLASHFRPEITCFEWYRSKSNACAGSRTRGGDCLLTSTPRVSIN